MLKELMKKDLEGMESTQDVLNAIPLIQSALLQENEKEFSGVDNNHETYEVIEAIGYEIASKKAKSFEELGLCITAIEQNYFGPLCQFEWIPQIVHKHYNPEDTFTDSLKSLEEHYSVGDTEEE